MKRGYVLLWSLLLAQHLCAAETGVPLQQAKIDLTDKAALQRGARTFVNYCSGCHSATYMRYNRIAKDLDIAEDVVKTNLMFNEEKIGETMEASMSAGDALKWLGMAPPDLSLSARSRGADWVFSYLLGFYLDPARTTGVNNLYFDGTSMPHVLWQLQGWQSPAEKHGNKVKSLTSASGGTLDEAEYRETVKDLVSFMVYLAEPAKLVRYRIGAWVMGFLLVLVVLTYLLKQEYWRDIH